MNISTIVETINEELSKYDNLDSIELEARLGIYDMETKKFDSNIGSPNYEKINEMLDTFKNWESVTEVVTNEKIIDNLRLITDLDNNETVIEKIKLKSFTFVLEDLPLDMRVTISREIKQPVSKFKKTKKGIYNRIKERTSRVFQNASIDLTSVKVPVGKALEQTFEFEVEHIGDFKNPKEAIFQMLYKLLDADYMLDGFQRTEGMLLPIDLFSGILI